MYKFCSDKVYFILLVLTIHQSYGVGIGNAKFDSEKRRYTRSSENDAPTFKEDTSDITKAEHDKIKIRCELESGYPADFKWYFNGTKFIKRQGVKLKTVKSKGFSTITIKSLLFSDAGQYVCSASKSDDFSVAVNKTFILEVIESCNLCPEQSYCLNSGKCCMDVNDFNMYCECTEGFTGYRCDTRDRVGRGDTKLLIICIVGAMFLCALLALSMYLCKRFRENPCRKQSAAQAPTPAQTNGIDKHEYTDEQNTENPPLLPAEKNLPGSDETTPMASPNEDKYASLGSSDNGYSTTVH